MAKQIFGTKTGVCSVCGINCWDASGGKPAVWPCGVRSCPYETEAQQARIGLDYQRSDIGNSLQLTIFEG